MIPAGSTLPRYPNGRRLSTICASPRSGPQLVSTPWETAPSALPITIAATACQNVRPKKSTAMIPTKIVANSMFGDTQVQNICDGRPCRSASGIGSAPPGSTAVALLPYSWCSVSRDVLAVIGHPPAGPVGPG